MEEVVLTQLQTDLTNSIRDSLENHIYSNAVFLAERLLAENDCEESRAILAECYMAEMKAYKAYHVLKGCKSDQNRYKFAIICLKLNRPKELQEAEKVLLGPARSSNSKLGLSSGSKYDHVPNGAFGFYVLGIISEKLHRIADAKELYKKALEINPSLWTAYEKLLKLGEFINPDEIFQESRFKLLSTQKVTRKSGLVLSSSSHQLQKPSDMGIEESFPKPTTAVEIESEQGFIRPKQPPLKSESFSTNNTSFTNFGEDSNLMRLPQDPIMGRFGGLKPPTPEFHDQSSSPQKVLQGGSYNGLMSLLQAVGEPYMQLISYNCQNSIGGFQKLAENHYNTGWVMCNIGRAYWECAKYSDAEKYFEQAYTIEPYKLEGLEYYSTCLWHMKKQVELCKLAHSALEKSMFAPEPWIVLGNCFSLQKEHENALKFFNRAIQLNSSLPYAHTLSGHEYVYNEDFQRARKCFENALNIDIRHYNAWWGLGYISYKQEKYERAIDSFLKALSINPKNPVLYSYLGMTCVAQDNLVEALKYFQQSELLDDKNVMNRFQKANVLFKLEQYEQALSELEILRKLMPREAPIPQLIGKIYKQLGIVDKAHHFFTLALDLENKDTQKIKAMIDALHETNEFNDDPDM